MSIMHFYTTRTDEPSSGYVSEGITCYIFDHPEEGASPLYRWRHPVSNHHFYTTDPAPIAGYVFEKIECYVPNSSFQGAIPLYRWFNPNTGDHLYTLDQNGELAPSSGYVAEGIACYVFPPGIPDTAPLYRWVAGDQTWCIRLSRLTSEGWRGVYSKNVHVGTYDEAKSLSNQILSEYNAIQVGNGMPTADRAEEPKLGGC
ncbi:hypothetical protein ACYZTM_01855 [Pseudomonas sp. MDT2-39-1]